MYPSTNENNSSAKTMIDTWYQNNMTAYTEYLEDTIWCNDRSVYKTESSNIYHGAYGRNESAYSPSIECPNTNDKFTVSGKVGNGKLTYPVALLTSDEATRAGHGWSIYNDKSYLYTNQDWWLLSPRGLHQNIAYVFYVNSNSAMGYYRVNYTSGVRPALSLAPGTLVAEGTDGSPESPFEVLIKQD